MKIEVADNLRGSHELVSQANQELQNASTDRHKMIIPPDRPVLNIITSKGSLRRALLIMDALLKALEQRGYTVASGPTITIGGTTLRFSMTESLETQREPAEDHDLDGPYTFGHSRFNEKRVPSGRFTLEILEGGPYWTEGCQRTWRDTKTKRLEDRLNSFVAGMIKMAARIKEHEEELERQAAVRREEEARREEESRQRAEKRKRYKAEQARVNTLLLQVEKFQKSRQVRELIEAVRQAHSADGVIEPKSETAQWIEWATRQADRLDPLRPSPPSILDEEIDEADEHQRGFRRTW